MVFRLDFDRQHFNHENERNYACFLTIFYCIRNLNHFIFNVVHRLFYDVFYDFYLYDAYYDLIYDGCYVLTNYDD